MDLRCPNGIKFGEINSDFIEVKCRSKRCGSQPGVIVIHRFTHQGSLIQTLRFQDAICREERNNGTSIRSA